MGGGWGDCTAGLAGAFYMSVIGICSLRRDSYLNLHLYVHLHKTGDRRLRGRLPAAGGVASGQGGGFAPRDAEGNGRGDFFILLVVYMCVGVGVCGVCAI